jgi:glycine betaine/choline ABC-type transport system substrate-binding protein
MRGAPASLLLILAALAALLAAGCAEDRTPLRVGSKDFTEQKLLAEMMALLAEREGIRVQRAIPYGESRKVVEAIERGVIDAYPEYSGTLLGLAGVEGKSDAESASAAVRERVEPLGLRWLQPFGFQNSFALAVRRDVAIRRNLGDISDLTTVVGPLRFAVDEGFARRPVDGLPALVRAYGLRLGEVTALPVHDRQGAYEALLEQRADVAGVFTTDARLRDYGVVVLKDDLGFFPAYEAAPLVRAGVLDSMPALQQAWGALAGRIDDVTISRLNARVELAGEDYRDVAQDFLEELGLLPRKSAVRSPRKQVVLAVNSPSDLGSLPIRAADAIRTVMPARHLVVETVARPADAVRTGRARFGVVGAEEFYRMAPDGRVSQVGEIEAVGVVGTRFAHVVSSSAGPDPREWTRLGVEAEGGSSWTVARFLLHALGLGDRIQLVTVQDPQGWARALESGEVDGLLLMVEQGHAGLLKLLRDSDVRLLNVDALGRAGPALRFPFLRPARIPAGTYPGQEEVVDTVAAQVVLASRVPTDEDVMGESGPGFVPGVFTRLPQRLPPGTAQKLARALQAREDVDPLLPVSPGLKPDTPPVKRRVEARPAAATLNVLAILFLVAMAWLLFRELPSKPALPSRVQRDE